MIRKAVFFAFINVSFFLLSSCVHTKESTEPITERARVEASALSSVTAPLGAVTSSDPFATQVGLDVLQQGGNAVDAAVAVMLTMAVTYPTAGALGGGGFMMYYNQESQETVAIDYREKAPLKASRDMFLDKQGEVVQERSRFSYLASGVPGNLAGIDLALRQYGSMSLSELIQPAINLAAQGFPITKNLSDTLKKTEKRLKKWPSSAEIFFKPDGTYYEVGELLVQKDLAKSLKLIAEQGIQAFYQGAVGQMITQDFEKNGGLISMEDLAQYEAKIRVPIQGEYRGYRIFSMPPPSSGGVHVVQILNILEGYDMASLGHNTAKSIHVMAEAMKYAYADRSEFLGDSDFTKIPLKGLTSKTYAEDIRQKIDLNKAEPSSNIKPGEPWPYESNQTTHFSVVDAQGNGVSNTFTLNFTFGSGLVAAGTGILMNNQMDDFSSKPGVPNAYGLLGGEANAIESEKRMLSSMSPTIVTDRGKIFLLAGSPGGSRIITTTLQVIANVIDHKMTITEAVNAYRIHHQWFPEEIRVEEGIHADVLNDLEKMGHSIAVKSPMGSANAILVDPETDLRYATADLRRQGSALGY